MSRGISEVAQRRRRWDILDIPQFSEAANVASGEMNKGLPAAHSVKTRAERAFLLNSFLCEIISLLLGNLL